MKKNIDECGIRNGEMIENKRIKIGIISDTHGLLRTTYYSPVTAFFMLEMWTDRSFWIL